jgi:DnaA family protein
MKQLLLNLDLRHAQTFASFVVGEQVELIALMQRFAEGKTGVLGERAVYIWGEHGAGKTHLLQALQCAHNSRCLTQSHSIDEFEFDPTIGLYLIDDCHQLDDVKQIAAFNLYNQVRERGGLWVATGDAAPALLSLREDLRTRLGWGLVFQLNGLTDQQKINALEHAAAARGVTLPEGALPYLITHFRRDMPSLSALLDALINLSLEIKRPITMPFVREVMNQFIADGASNPDSRHKKVIHV